MSNDMANPASVDCLDAPCRAHKLYSPIQLGIKNGLKEWQLEEAAVFMFCRREMVSDGPKYVGKLALTGHCSLDPGRPLKRCPC